MARPYWVVCRAAQIAVKVVRIGLGILMLISDRDDQASDFVLSPVRKSRTGLYTCGWSTGEVRTDASRFHTAGLEKL